MTIIIVVKCKQIAIICKLNLALVVLKVIARKLTYW